MANNEPLISLATNLFTGYPLAEALDFTGGAGFSGVEISCIDGGCEHVLVDAMNADTLAAVGGMLAAHQLQVNGFGGHVDPTEEAGLRRLLKKMEFAKGLGAKIVNTNAGSLARLPEFYKNMKVIIDQAERLDIAVGLEPHGDIVSTGRESAAVLKAINHPLVRINYDTGNVFYHSAGQVRPEEDILYALDYIGYVHLKDIKVESDAMTYCPLGDGQAGVRKVLDVLKSCDRVIHMSMEVPVFVYCKDWQALAWKKVPLQASTITDVLRKSKACVEDAGFKV